MAPKPIPIPSAAVVDQTQLATVDWFAFWKSQADAVATLLGESAPTTGSPLYAQSLGWNYQPTGSISATLGGFAIFPRYGFGKIWIAQTDPPAIISVDPKTGLVVDNISVGVSGTNFPVNVCVTDTRIYFNDGLAGRVGYIDPTTNPPKAVFPAGLSSVAPTGSLPSSLSMRGLVWDGTNVWAGLSLSPVGSAKKISPSSNTILATVTLGDTPFYGPAYDGAGRIWWPNFVSNTATLIDINTNATSTIVTNPGPWAFFCTGDYMLLSENGSDTISSHSIGSAVDGGRWTLPAGSGLHDIVVVRNELWVTQSSSDKIFVFDWLGDKTSTPTAIRNFSVGPAASDPAGMCYVPPDVWFLNAQGDGGAAAPAAKLKRRRVDHTF